MGPGETRKTMTLYITTTDWGFGSEVMTNHTCQSIVSMAVGPMRVGGLGRRRVTMTYRRTHRRGPKAAGRARSSRNRQGRKNKKSHGPTSITKKAANKTGLYTAQEIQIMTANYNDLYNEGGEGYVPRGYRRNSTTKHKVSSASNNCRAGRQIPAEGEKTMTHHYAIQHTDFSRNDSDEKIRDWKTARVYRFSTRAERDAFCADSDNNDVINAKRANYIGYVDADNTILAEDTIRAARIAAGLTQKQLGEAAGLEHHRTAVCRIVGGRTRPV